MKKLLIATLGTASLVVVLAHGAAAAPDPTVDVCHIDQGNEFLDFGIGYGLAFGKVISVDEAALQTHLDHGDDTIFGPVDEAGRMQLEAIYGIRVPNADCGIVVYTF